MANTLTSLQPVIFEAAKVIPRELTGAIAAVRRDFNDNGVAKGDSIKVPKLGSMSTSSVTESQTFTAGSDRTAGTVTVSLSNFKEVSWHLTAEQERSLLNGGTAGEFARLTMEQAFRAMVNGIELHTWQTLYKGASRATGTAGTTPFASNLTALTAARKILVDNGVPVNAEDCTGLFDTSASTNLRDLTSLQKVNEAGSSATLRDGSLGDLFGFRIRESGQITTHTKGTGSGYLVNNAAGVAIGDTSVTVDTGTGTILAGDIVTLSGSSTNKYVVNSALASNSFSIGDPGAKVAAADNDAVAVGNNYTPNLALHRNAAVLIARPALQPEGAIADQMVVSDPASGLSMLMLRVPGNAMVSYYLRCVYECTVINSHMIATILG